MPGTLYVVATPIGNLEDVTLRALRVLREVALIAAEDTRRTSRLLQHYSISTPTTSLHEHNEAAKTPGLVQRLRDGESLALVSDAGTPVVSDPGARLVAAAHAAGVRVEPIPGASAAMAAVSASGFGGEGFVFAGFPPARAQARRRWLEALRAEPRPLVVYEAPHRIRDTLADMQAILGDRQIVMGRELTKIHEELVVGPISELLTHLAEPKGEFTLVVAPAESSETETVAPSSERVAEEFGRMTDKDGLGRREAIRALAERYHLPSRAIFALLEESRETVE